MFQEHPTSFLSVVKRPQGIGVMRTRHIIVRNRCLLSRIRREFEPLVASLTLVCRTILGDTLVDLRLLGSVARGDARPGESDLDVVALVRTWPSENVFGKLSAVTQQSKREYQVVRRIDLDVYEIVGLSTTDAIERLHQSGWC